MHRDFKELLKKANGVSNFVVVVNMDIRGFSAFSKEVESPDVAMFIKRVYQKIIDNYFPEASFFKPAGDGLIIIIRYSEDNLKKVVNNVVGTCLKLTLDFKFFCDDDPIINFKVPQKIGIGLSRGSACCLISNDKILDYSGRVLNLAARLMDLARPSGIVFDANFGVELLPDSGRKFFQKDCVFLRGLAESEPIDIYYTEGFTKISKLYKNPIKDIKWNSVTDRKKFKDIKKIEGQFQYSLTSQPIDPKQITVKVTHGMIVKGRRRENLSTFFDFNDFKYVLEVGKPVVFVDFGKLSKRLEENGLKDPWEVAIEIFYPES